MTSAMNILTSSPSTQKEQDTFLSKKNKHLSFFLQKESNLIPHIQLSSIQSKNQRRRIKNFQSPCPFSSKEILHWNRLAGCMYKTVISDLHVITPSETVQFTAWPQSSAHNVKKKKIPIPQKFPPKSQNALLGSLPIPQILTPCSNQEESTNRGSQWVNDEWRVKKKQKQGAENLVQIYEQMWKKLSYKNKCKCLVATRNMENGAKQTQLGLARKELLLFFLGFF